MKKGKGVMPERKDIYIETRTRKDGSIVNEKAARVIVSIDKWSIICDDLFMWRLVLYFV